MPAEVIPLRLNARVAADHPFQVVDANGALVAVGAGWSARAQIRETQGGATLLHEFTGATVTVAGNTVTLHQLATDFATATWRTGYYDLLLTDPNGRPSRIAEGPVVLSPATTRI